MWHKLSNLNPEQYLQGVDLSKKGICMVVAELLTKALLGKGFARFSIHEGYVDFDDDNNRFQHTWIELATGQIVDPSLKQFSDFDIENVRYEKSKEYTPQEYLALCEKYPES